MDNRAIIPQLLIEDLPIEMLYEILKWFDDDNMELENVQKVCQRWYTIVDKWIGREVHDCSPHPMVIHPSNPDLSRVGMELVSEIGVRGFHVSEDHLEAPSSPLPFFKYPFLLRYVSLHGSLHADLFNSLMNGTVNLSEIHISLNVLTHLRNSDLKSLNFPRLTSLQMRTGVDEDGNEIVSSASLPNLRTLLGNNRFPLLTHLVVEFMVQTFEDLETLKVLIGFIHVHRSLKDLYVWMSFSPDLRPVHRLAYQDQVKTLISEIRAHKCCHSLKTLHIQADHVGENYPHLDIWKEVLLKQTSLEVLDWESGHISNEELKTIVIRNGASLKGLRINLENDIRQINRQVDCSIISPLQRLQTLKLVHMSEITGTSHLPSSLVEICIEGILRSEEVDYILLRLPNLQKLYYFNWHHHDHPDEAHTVRLRTLEQVVRDRRMEVLSLNCLARDFPLEEGISNGDPANPGRLTCTSRRCITWALNGSGYYASGLYSTYPYFI